MRIVLPEELQQEIKNLFKEEISIEDCREIITITNKTNHIINSNPHEIGGCITFTNLYGYKIYTDKVLLLSFIPFLGKLENMLKDNNRKSLINSTNNSYFIVDNSLNEFVNNLLLNNNVTYYQSNDPGIIYANYLITNYINSNAMDSIYNTEDRARQLLIDINESIKEKQMLPNLFREV